VASGAPTHLTQERWRAYLALRTSLILVMAGALRLDLSFPISSVHQSTALDAVAMLVLMASGIGLWSQRYSSDLSQLAMPQVMLDPLLAGLIVFATGGEESPLSFFFVLVVMNGTNVLGKGGAYGAASRPLP